MLGRDKDSAHIVQIYCNNAIVHGSKYTHVQFESQLDIEDQFIRENALVQALLTYSAAVAVDPSNFLIWPILLQVQGHLKSFEQNWEQNYIPVKWAILNQR